MTGTKLFFVALAIAIAVPAYGQGLPSPAKEAPFRTMPKPAGVTATVTVATPQACSVSGGCGASGGLLHGRIRGAVAAVMVERTPARAIVARVLHPFTVFRHRCR